MIAKPKGTYSNKGYSLDRKFDCVVFCSMVSVIICNVPITLVHFASQYLGLPIEFTQMIVPSNCFN